LNLLKLLPFLRPRNAKVVVFVHGIEAWQKQNAWTSRLLRRTDLLLGNSQFTLKRFEQCAPVVAGISRRVIHLGIAEPDVRSARPRTDKAVAIMLGRMDKRENYKGHREIIEAWPFVRQRIPEAELWVLGEGDLRPQLEQQVTSLGIESNVKFFGKVSTALKEELLMQSRCLLLPSRGEGFGLVYLEAMRKGRPCLVSTLDAGREVVSPPEAGLAADPANVIELAAATIRLLSLGAEWEQWSAKARRRYETQFTALHFQGRLLAALRSLNEIMPASVA
jgi:phosphatidylinositol alpha-1,6-mannosyltransferase